MRGIPAGRGARRAAQSHRRVHDGDLRYLQSRGSSRVRKFLNGTDPINFQAAERYFQGKAGEVAGDEQWPPHERGLPFQRLALTHSLARPSSSSRWNGLYLPSSCSYPITSCGQEITQPAHPVHRPVLMTSS